MRDEIVAVFIDGSNFYKVLKYNKGRTDIDFQKLVQKFVGDRQLLRVYYYTATVDQFTVPQMLKEQQKFFQFSQLCLILSETLQVFCPGLI